MTIFDESTLLVPADMVRGPGQGHWTYQEYAALPRDDKRYEVMDGVLLMAPSPSVEHQSTVNWFAFYLTQYVVLIGIGRVFPAPFDVELAVNRVVQPDVCVVLNENVHKLTTSRLVGAPDLVVEVASPATAAYDRLKKLDVYAQSGVREYWIATPANQSIEFLVLNNGTYNSLGIFQGQNLIPSQLVAGIQTVHVEQFFV